MSHRDAEARQAVLEQVIGRAPLDQGGRPRVVQVAGDDNDRNIACPGLQRRDGAHSIKLRRAVIAQHDLGRAIERREVVGLVVDHPRAWREPARTQLREHQLRVGQRIVDDQHVEWRRHDGFRRSGSLQVNRRGPIFGGVVSQHD